MTIAFTSPRLRARALTIAAVAAAATVLGACGGGSSAEAATLTVPAPKVGPEGSAFWDVSTPPPAGAKRGDILQMQERRDAPPGAKGWNVVYVSEIKDGTLAYVSGEIYVPADAPGTPRDIVLWNHPTTGVADACAPSRTNLIRPVDPERVPGILQLLAKGYVVVMSDYPGQGLPGPAFYMAGQPNARASLDMLRVARNFPNANPSARFVMYGWSQGGQTTMWAESIAAQYVPEFKGLGAGLIAPAVRARDLVTNTVRRNLTEQAGYLISTLPGIRASFPNLKYRDVLTTEGLEQFPAMADGCFDIWRTAATVKEPFVHGAVAEGSPWWNALTAVDNFKPAGTMPFVIFQGSTDTTTPVSFTQRERAALCTAGSKVQYLEFPGLEHVPVVPEASKAFPTWAEQRFKGADAPSNCSG